MGRGHKQKKLSLELRRKTEEYRQQRLAKEAKERKWIFVGIVLLCGVAFLTRNLSFWHASFPGFYFFFANGLLLTGIAARNLYWQLRAQRWPAAQCEIQARDVYVVSGRGHSAFHPLVYYTYVINEVTYTSHVIRFGLFGFFDYMRAVERMKKYAEGSMTRCYYDPHKPHIAVLERGVRLRWPIVMMICAIGCFVLAIVLPDG